MVGVDGNWQCPACNNVNFGSRDVCNRCGFPKAELHLGTTAAPKSASRPPAAAGPGPGPFAPGPSDWGQPKKGAPIPGVDGNWKCSNCGNVNFGFRDTCNRCGAPRSEQDPTESWASRKRSWDYAEGKGQAPKGYQPNTWEPMGNHPTPWEAAPAGKGYHPGDWEAVPAAKGYHPGDWEAMPAGKGYHPGDPAGKGYHPHHWDAPAGKGHHPGDWEAPVGKGCHPGNWEAPAGKGYHPGDWEAPAGKGYHPGDWEAVPAKGGQKGGAPVVGVDGNWRCPACNNAPS